MWKILRITIFISLFFNCANAEELRALLEGPDEEIIYGDVVTMTLSLWPIEESSQYHNLLSQNLFEESVKVLNVEKIEISKNNEEALVFTFTGVLLDKEIPETILINEKEIQLMKRSLDIQEFHPETEQVILFQQKIEQESKLLMLILVTVLIISLFALRSFRKSLKKKEVRKREMEKHNRVIKALEGLSLREKVDYFFKGETNWLSYYQRELWNLQKRKLEKVVYKKEWLPEEQLEIEKEVKAIVERIEKWSF